MVRVVGHSPTYKTRLAAWCCFDNLTTMRLFLKSRPLFHAFRGIALGLALSLSVTPALALQVVIVLSENAATYHEIANTIKDDLTAASKMKHGVTVLQIASVESIQKIEPAPDVVVAVGVKASQALAASDLKMPVLSILVPRASFEKIARHSGRGREPRKFSAIYLDQPWSRQMRLIRLALPGRNRVGVLLGAESQEQVAALLDAASEQNLQLLATAVETADGLLPALGKALEESDVLLAVPDNQIFNSGTLQNVLLTSYRYHDPVVAFSPAYVRAGALLSVHSLPVQLAHHAAEVLQHAATAMLPPPQYPKYFAVSVNLHVARSLGLQIEDELLLERRLKEAEVAP